MEGIWATFIKQLATCKWFETKTNKQVLQIVLTYQVELKRSKCLDSTSWDKKGRDSRPLLNK
jgi:hypothetical protein